jgi:hypothetical protein
VGREAAACVGLSCMATMFPSDDAIVAAIREELRTADMNNTTVKTIRAAVSAKLGVDLTEKKDFVKQTVDRLLAEQVAQDTAADADADADEDAADEDAPEAGMNCACFVCSLSVPFIALLFSFHVQVLNNDVFLIENEPGNLERWHRKNSSKRISNVLLCTCTHLHPLHAHVCMRISLFLR